MLSRISDKQRKVKYFLTVRDTHSSENKKQKTSNKMIHKKIKYYLIKAEEKTNIEQGLYFIGFRRDKKKGKHFFTPKNKDNYIE